MLQWLLCALVAAAVPAASDPPDVSFTVEPSHRVTFSHTGVLPAGTHIDLELERLPNDQAFLVSLCGKDCNTAKVVYWVRGQGLETQDDSFSVKEPGRYYFWIQRRTPEGEVGPVPVADISSQESAFRAAFEGGATVSGRLRAPEPPASPAPRPDVAPKRDAIEIVDVAPAGPLTRGVETELTVEAVVDLRSLDEGICWIGVNSESPTKFRMLDNRAVVRGPQHVVFHVKVVPVDWAERGRFQVLVNAGSRDLGRTWKPRASAARPLDVTP